MSAKLRMGSEPVDKVRLGALAADKVLAGLELVYTNCPPLPAPATISVAAGNAQATVTWADVAAASSYSLQYRAVGSSAWLTTGQPGAPASVAATAGSAQLLLSWAAPSVSGTSAITGYVVEYTPSGGAAQTVTTGSTSTSYTLAGLANGTSYSVRVAAVNASGAGAYSSATAATPAQPQPDEHWPSVRVLLRMEGSDGGTVFTNTASTPITVTRSASAVTSTNAARFGSSGLGGGWLQLSDGGGSGSAFNVGLNWTLEAWVKFNTLSTSPAGNGIFSLWDPGQGALTSLRAFESGMLIVNGLWNDNGLRIVANEWHHIAFVRGGNFLRSFVNGQLVLENDLGGAQPFLQTSIFLLRDPVNNSGPANAVMDEFRFTRDVARYSANFTPPTAAFTAVGPPTANAPTSLAATAGNAQLALSWTAPTYAGTSAITGYVVEFTPSGGSAQTVFTGVTSTSYALAGLTNGTSYSVRVAAVNAAGTGAYSQAATGTPTNATPITHVSGGESVFGAGSIANPYRGSSPYAPSDAFVYFRANISGTLVITFNMQQNSEGDNQVAVRRGTQQLPPGSWFGGSGTRNISVTAGTEYNLWFTATFGSDQWSAYITAS